MDILYIIGEGISENDYFDLRCSLRSLEKYGKNFDRVFIAGYCPDWLSTEVVKVPFTQPYPGTIDIVEKHLNIQETIRYVVANTDISSEFVVSMSDHFLTRTVDFAQYPFYCRLTSTGTLIPNKENSNYSKFLKDTRDYLKSKNLSILFTTIHRDMKVTKNSVTACSSMFDEILENKIPVEPFLLLGNWEYSNGVSKDDIRFIEDYKIRQGSNWWMSSPEIIDQFSVGPFKHGIGFYTLLGLKYKVKSKYEL